MDLDDVTFDNQPPLVPLFSTPSSFGRETMHLASLVPEGSTFVVNKSCHTWMCTALAAGVASKSKGAVVCVPAQPVVPASQCSIQSHPPDKNANERQSGIKHSIDSDIADTISKLSAQRAPVLLCSAWIHERNSAQLKAFVDYLKAAQGITVSGTVGVRVELNLRTNWLLHLGPIHACSLAHGTCPPWQHHHSQKQRPVHQRRPSTKNEVEDASQNGSQHEDSHFDFEFSGDGADTSGISGTRALALVSCPDTIRARSTSSLEELKVGDVLPPPSPERISQRKMASLHGKDSFLGNDDFNETSSKLSSFASAAGPPRKRPHSLMNTDDHAKNETPLLQNDLLFDKTGDQNSTDIGQDDYRLDDEEDGSDDCARLSQDDVGLDEHDDDAEDCARLSQNGGCLDEDYDNAEDCARLNQDVDAEDCAGLSQVGFDEDGGAEDCASLSQDEDLGAHVKEEKSNLTVFDSDQSSETAHCALQSKGGSDSLTKEGSGAFLLTQQAQIHEGDAVASALTHPSLARVDPPTDAVYPSPDAAISLQPEMFQNYQSGIAPSTTAIPEELCDCTKVLSCGREDPGNGRSKRSSVNVSTPPEDEVETTTDRDTVKHATSAGSTTNDRISRESTDRGNGKESTKNGSKTAEVSSSTVTPTALLQPQVTVIQHSTFAYSANNPSEDRASHGVVKGLGALIGEDDDAGSNRFVRNHNFCEGLPWKDTIDSNIPLRETSQIHFRGHENTRFCHRCQARWRKGQSAHDDDSADDPDPEAASGRRVDQSGEGEEGTATVYVVADGHGGGLASQFVADHIIDEVGRELKAANEDARNRRARGPSAAGGPSCWAPSPKPPPPPVAATPAEGNHDGDKVCAPPAEGGWRQALVRRALSNAFLATEAKLLRSLDASWESDPCQRSHSPPSSSSLSSTKRGRQEMDPCASKTTGGQNKGSSGGKKTGGAAIPRVGVNNVPGVCNAGSCVVLVCVLDGWVHTAHVGDCRAVLVTVARDDDDDDADFPTAQLSTTSDDAPVVAPPNASPRASEAALMPTESGSTDMSDGGAASSSSAATSTTTTTSSSPTKKHKSSPSPSSSPEVSNPRVNTRQSLRGSGGGDPGAGASSSSSSSFSCRRAPARPPALRVSGVPLTVDHTCYNPAEVALVTARVAEHAAMNEVAARQRGPGQESAGESGGGARGHEGLQQQQQKVEEDEEERGGSSRQAAPVAAKPDLEPIRPSRNDRRLHELRLKRQRLQQQRRIAGISEEVATPQGAAAPLGENGGRGEADSRTAGIPTKKKNNRRAPAPPSAVKPPLLRVAGSLAVTRAVGDMYLKHPRYASEELRPHVPYITATPDTSSRRLSSPATTGRRRRLPTRRCCAGCDLPLLDERSGSPEDADAAPPVAGAERSAIVAIVLASDGIWEVAQNNQVADWLAAHLVRTFHATFPGEPESSCTLTSTAQGNELRRSSRESKGGAAAGGGGGGKGGSVSCSQELVLQALASVAASHRVSASELHLLKLGAERRRFHDDITATVVLLSPAKTVFAPRGKF